MELWTKRNFRCDCGNSKFGEFFCKILASKDAENSNNVYNHNFKSTYCTCNLPYPDPNAEEQVEMIQCCICEDWFHEEHIGLSSTDKVSDYCFLGSVQYIPLPKKMNKKKRQKKKYIHTHTFTATVRRKFYFSLL